MTRVAVSICSFQCPPPLIDGFIIAFCKNSTSPSCSACPHSGSASWWTLHLPFLTIKLVINFTVLRYVLLEQWFCNARRSLGQSTLKSCDWNSSAVRFPWEAEDYQMVPPFPASAFGCKSCTAVLHLYNPALSVDLNCSILFGEVIIDFRLVGVWMRTVLFIVHLRLKCTAETDSVTVAAWCVIESTWIR